MKTVGYRRHHLKKKDRTYMIRFPSALAEAAKDAYPVVPGRDRKYFDYCTFTYPEISSDAK